MTQLREDGITHKLQTAGGWWGFPGQAQGF